MPADEPVGDRMEGAGPGQAHLLLHLPQDALRPARHLQGGAAREREKQDPLGLRALEYQVRHPVREGIGLAGARAREDEERRRPGERRLA